MSQTEGIMPGIRVVRGPDWEWAEQDGGDGSVGTVIKYDLAKRKEVFVCWDNGTLANYRCCDPYDVRVLDSSTAGLRHEGVVCAGCSSMPIYGTRWHCSDCRVVDLCSKCYHGDKHSLQHRFSREPIPNGPRIPVLQARQSARKVFSRGIFAGAKVVRGKDWIWSNQDGGSGSRGRVQSVENWNESSHASGAMVEWEVGRIRNLYRMGFSGKVDLKVVKETKGSPFYKDHLPLLGESMVHRRGCPVAPGDYVKIVCSLSEAQEKQVGHGGWNHTMAEAFSSVGRVVAIDNEGDAVVTYSSGGKWTFNSEILSKVFVSPPSPADVKEGSPQKIKQGDFVKVSSDIRLVKKLQIGHGEWAEPMKDTLGRVGQVVSVFSDGDVKVKVSGVDRPWTFNPECVAVVQPDSAPLTPSTTEHLSEMLRTIFETHTPTRSLEGLVNAAANGNLSIVMEILGAQQCGVNDRHEGQSALHLAAQSGHLDVVRYLLEQGAAMDTEDNQGSQPIHYAAVGAEPEVVRLLADEGADINVRNRRQQTPLHQATVKGHMTVIRTLLSLCCHASLQDLDGDSPLHDAINKKREDIVELLMEHHADPSVVNKNGFNCLHLAALKGNSGPMRMMLSRLPASCSVDDIKDDGFTALHLAALNNHRAVAELLLEHGASRNAQNLRKATPLHLAIERQNMELVRLLVDSGAETNVQDKDGRSPLHEAVQSHMLTQLKRLAGSASDLTAGITGVTTPIEKKSSASIATFLVSQGADPYLKNTNEQTPIDLCSDPNLNRILLKAHQDRQLILSTPEPGSVLSYSTEDLTTVATATAGEEPEQCTVCSDAPREAVLLPCTHLLLCWPCAARVKKCLLCREPVQSRQKVEECLVCSDKMADLVFLPCGHVVTCQECGKVVKKCLTCKEVVLEKKVVLRASTTSQTAGPAGTSPNNDQSKHLLKEVELLKEQLQCSICCDRKKSCVLNCGHTFCQMCADQLRTCPICTRTISKRLIMYNS